MRRSRRPYLLALLGVFAAYVAGGRLGLQLATVNASTTAVWPPAGIALAALVLLGPRVWPAVFAGAFTVSIMTSGDAYAALLIGAGSTFESSLAAYLIVRLAGGRDAFLHAATILRFAVVALAVPLIGATSGVATLVLTGHGEPYYVLPVWSTWWIGHATGALIVAPLILVWATRVPRIRRRQGPDHLCSALRAGATAVALASLVGVVGVADGIVPFMSSDPLYSLAVLQSLLSAASVGGLGLAAALLQRQKSERSLPAVEAWAERRDAAA